jgi:regulator of cell morphogenesis and NO signaling
MTFIDPAAGLGDLVAQRPARATLFERLRFDYCCGGAQTLAEACEQQALDFHTIRRVIEAFDDGAQVLPGLEDRDWRRASLGHLCDHIVTVHHDGLRRELPQMTELLDSVIRVHGPVHPALYKLAPVFAGLRDELVPHLELEERLLFPACRALDADGADSGPIDEVLLATHERDHRHIGAALAVLRDLTDDYDVDQAICRTHRRWLEALDALELDLHRHIHEENSVLFPRVRALLATVPGTATAIDTPVTSR